MNRVYIDLNEYDEEQVQQLIIQVEGLYIFSVLKATLASQKNDPFIKNLLNVYRVPLNSKSLYYYDPK